MLSTLSMRSHARGRDVNKGRLRVVRMLGVQVAAANKRGSVTFGRAKYERVVKGKEGIVKTGIKGSAKVTIQPNITCRRILRPSLGSGAQALTSITAGTESSETQSASS